MWSCSAQNTPCSVWTRYCPSLRSGATLETFPLVPTGITMIVGPPDVSGSQKTLGILRKKTVSPMAWFTCTVVFEIYEDCQARINK